MGRLGALCALVALAACRFDPSGIAPLDWSVDDGGEAGPDRAVPDTWPDAPPRPDAPLPPDLLPPPDTGGARPLTASELGLALDKARVRCVDKQGTDKGYDIPIVDSTTVKYFAGSVTTPGAPTETLTWLGSSPAVTIVYDLNACDEEYPGRSSWGSAGLLVREASLDAKNRLVLQPGAGIYDINLIDVLSDGTFQGTDDFAKADDSKLAIDTPQLVNPVTRAKEVIVELGLP